MSVSQLNIQHSLRTIIEDETGIPSVWVYDGVKLPEEKPFTTVEQMMAETEIISKGRQAVRTIFHFQVGVHARNPNERARYQDVLQRLFLFGKIPLIDAETGAQNGHLRVNAPYVTPIPAEDISDKSNYFRLYFDVTVDVVYN